MKRRASTLNFSLRNPNRIVWDHELTPQEFDRQPARGRKNSSISLPQILLNFLQRAKVATLLVITFAGLLYLIPTFFNSSSELLKGLNPPKPISLLDATSRLATLSPAVGTEVFHKIKRGDTLGSIAQKYNLPITEASSINETLDSYRAKEKLSHPLKPGTTLSLVVDPEGVQQLSVPISVGKTLNIKKGGQGTYHPSIQEVQRKRSQRVAIGVIESSFAEAAKSSGLSYSMVDELVDLFGDRVVFHRDFRQGDRFSIIYSEEQLINGQILGNDEIIGASVEVNGKTLYAIRYVGKDGRIRFFDKEGNLLGNAFLRYPVKFSRISSLFTESRFHPIHKTNRPHNGVDFAAPTGTAVRSVATGKVTFAGRNGAAGIMVRIQHNDRYTTEYFHLSKIEQGVRKGTFVERGQVIGAVGSTGSSTGPHLHYGFFDKGKYVDPLKIDLPTVDDLRSGQKPERNFITRTKQVLDSYLDSPTQRMVFNRELPKKHLSIVAKSLENA